MTRIVRTKQTRNSTGSLKLSPELAGLEELL
jgi:hypothetical protein